MKRKSPVLVAGLFRFCGCAWGDVLLSGRQRADILSFAR